MLLIAGLSFLASSFIGMLMAFSGEVPSWLDVYVLLLSQAIFGAFLVVRHVNR